MVATSREKHGQGYPSPPVVQPLNRKWFCTLFDFSQMRESSFGMLRGNVCVASLTMLNGFIQMCNRFVQMGVFASPLGMVPRFFRMCHDCISMTLFTMVHRFLCVRDGVLDVTGWGWLSVQHRHTSERC
jgi:hypothetical protein